MSWLNYQKLLMLIHNERYKRGAVHDDIFGDLKPMKAIILVLVCAKSTGTQIYWQVMPGIKFRNYYVYTIKKK